jgi:hypothetical protein
VARYGRTLEPRPCEGLEIENNIGYKEEDNSENNSRNNNHVTNGGLLFICLRRKLERRFSHHEEMEIRKWNFQRRYQLDTLFLQ